MSFSPVLQVKKLLNKMRTERGDASPGLKRIPSRTLSEEYSSSTREPMDFSPSFSRFRKYSKVDSPKTRLLLDDNTPARVQIQGDSPLDVLPPEALMTIFTFLEAKDLSRARAVNHQWKEFAEDDLLWKNLCDFDWGIHTNISSTWRQTYNKIDELFSDGVWEGMSKWVEPVGFDNEQKTTARLCFPKRAKSPLNTQPQTQQAPSSWLSLTPASIRKVVAAQATNEENNGQDPKYKKAPYKVVGSGVTINAASPSPFKIEGQRSDSDETGCNFEWGKHFENHTSTYSGRMDYVKGTVSGTIDYNDGTTHWKGIFHYTKVHNKRSKNHSINA